VRDLDERRIRGHVELRLRVALAKVTHGAVVDQVQRLVWTEKDADRPIDAVQVVGERLIAADVGAGEITRVLLARRGATRQVRLIGLRTVERELR